MKAAIFDVDGTLANVSSIRYLLHQPNPKTGRLRKDFDSFHNESVNVPPNQWVAEQARELKNSGMEILIVTARKHRWRHHTAWFLALNNIPSDGLWMRNNDDNRKDHLVKEDILKRIINLGYDPVIAFDDNPNVINLWKQYGIETVLIPGWENL